MSYPVFTVPAGDVLPVFFGSYAAESGASAVLSDLLASDIEIYKDGSTTQRASDAGYTLLDTDGINFDGITGINGISIDTGDNTDDGFYAVGSWYTVVVSAVTVDTQTVNFIACQFRIVEAEATAGRVMATTAAVSAGAIDATAIAANAITSAELADSAANKIADALLTRDWTSVAGEAARSVLNALRPLRNRVAIAGGVQTVYEEDDSTEAWTADVTTTAGDPISEIDPT